MNKIKGMINKYYKNLSIPLKASIWFIVCSFLQKGISFLTTPIFARIMTTEEYGLVSLFLSWEEIISIIVSFKLSEAVFSRTLVNYENDKREVLAAFQFLTSIILIICLAVYFLFHTLLFNIIKLSTIYMILMFVNIYFDSSFKLWATYKKFNYKYISLVVVTIIIAVLNPTIGLILVLLLKNKSFARIFSIVLVSVIINVFVSFYNFGKINKKTLKKICLDAFKFNIVLIPHYLSQIILNQGDRIMINNIVGTSYVALYSIAYTIGAIITMVTQSINSAYVPWMFRQLKNEKFLTIKKMNNLLMGLVCLLIIVLLMISPELLLFIGGKNYYKAVDVVFPVTCSMFFTFTYTLFANVEMYYNVKKYITIGTTISALLNIFLNYIFINKFGYVAAAYTTLICYIVYGFFHIFISKKIIEKKCNSNVDLGIKNNIFLGLMCMFFTFFAIFIKNFIILRLIVLTLIIIILIIYLYKNKESLISIFIKERRKTE